MALTEIRRRVDETATMQCGPAKEIRFKVRAKLDQRPVRPGDVLTLSLPGEHTLRIRAEVVDHEGNIKGVRVAR